MLNFQKSAAAFGVAAILLSACGTEADPTVDPTATDTPEAVETDAAPAETMAPSEEMAEAGVAFTNVADGDTITSPFEVTFEATGVTVAQAGEVVEGEGHMHIMVDVPCVAAGEVVPSDENHLHFGDGSLSATLELEAGVHTLCLQFADGVHTATDLTQEITVTVA